MLLLENRRHHNIILEFNGRGVGVERWKVYPLLSESEFNYQRIRHYVNSCNGFLFFFDQNDGEAYICNPTTNESRIIPFPPSVHSPPPGVSPMFGCSGLGFDSRSNDYKFIIAVSHHLPPLTRYAELYSLKTDSWKTFTDFPTHTSGFTAPCVYADGSIYWLSQYRSNHSSIDSFDIADETFSSFDITHLFPAADSYRLRLSSDDSPLGLVAYKINSPYCLELWVKTSTAGSACGWNINKVLDFSLPQIFMDLGHRFPTHYLIFILGFSGEILYIAAANGEVFAYDCAANLLEKLQIRLRNYRNLIRNRHPVFISYVETTVSPSLDQLHSTL